MTLFLYRRIVYIILFSLIFTPLNADIASTDLPEIGDSAGAYLSPQEEHRLGQEFMRSVRQQATLIDDLDINAYVTELGQRLASCCGSASQAFSFFIVDDPSINAFAGPGGYIGVHSGLLLAAKNESELAGVLAHEIAHVTQRHLLRAYEASSRLGLPTAAAMIAAVLLGAATNSDAGIAAATAIQAGSLQYQINFTRANEKEADRIGIQTLGRANIDPYGMPDFFERLQRQSRLYGEQAPEFLMTHPVTTNRIAESKARAEQVGHKGKRDSLDFQLIRARLEVLNERDPQQSLARYQARVRQDASSRAAQYGLALAFMRNGRYDSAHRLLQALQRQDPDRALYRTTLAQLDMENGHPGQALQRLADTLKLYPRDVNISAQYARALLQNHQAERSQQVLTDLLQNPAAQTPAVYAMLARAASASGHAWQARQASAEMYYLNGQTRAAIEQLEQALKQPSLHRYDRASLEARLQAFKQMARDED